MSDTMDDFIYRELNKDMFDKDGLWPHERKKQKNKEVMQKQKHILNSSLLRPFREFCLCGGRIVILNPQTFDAVITCEKCGDKVR